MILKMAASDDTLQKAFEKIIIAAGYPDANFYQSMEKIRYSSIAPQVAGSDSKKTVISKPEVLVDFIFQLILYKIKTSGNKNDLYTSIHKFFKRTEEQNSLYSLKLKISFDTNYIEFVKVNDAIEFSGDKNNSPRDFILSIKNYKGSGNNIPQEDYQQLTPQIVSGKSNFYNVKSYLISFFYLNSEKISKMNATYEKFKIQS